MECFVYGTLTDPETVGSVLGDHEFVGAATLYGLHRVDGEYPTLAPGGDVAGRILRTDDAAALDAYEAVDRGLYVRVSVPVTDARGDARGDAQVYVGDPARLGAADEASWPGSGGFSERLRRYLDEHEVVVTVGE